MVTTETCSGQHNPAARAKSLREGGLIRIDGRQYTLCVHLVDGQFCGALVDVTERPRVAACCPDH